MLCQLHPVIGKRLNHQFQYSRYRSTRPMLLKTCHGLSEHDTARLAVRSLELGLLLPACRQRCPRRGAASYTFRGVSSAVTRRAPRLSARCASAPHLGREHHLGRTEGFVRLSPAVQGEGAGHRIQFKPASRVRAVLFLLVQSSVWPCYGLDEQALTGIRCAALEL